jgi:thiol-disulfide isomerase/thioredoxin
MKPSKLIARITLLTASAFLSLGACTTDPGADEADPYCGDGEANAGEQCDGSSFGKSNCQSAGFDEGEVGCTSECTLDVSACVVLDEDLDQLSIYDELAFGTDPLNPDSDGDGILDGIEVQNGSNALDIYSWPQGVGTWPNRLAAAAEDGVVGTGWGEGDTIFNFGWFDQYGQVVQLHQFYGYVVVWTLAALWCPPCQEAAKTSQALFEQHVGNGVIFIENMIDGIQFGSDATAADVTSWSTEYGLQFPVVYSEQAQSPPSVPTYYIFNRTLNQVQKFEGYPGDPALTAAINAASAL